MALPALEMVLLQAAKLQDVYSLGELYDDVFVIYELFSFFSVFFFIFFFPTGYVLNH